MAVGATIYFGSPESRRQIQEVSEAFQQAHELGLATILWVLSRSPAFKTAEGKITTWMNRSHRRGASHLGVIQVDIIKQKPPENNGGFTALKFGKIDPRVYSDLAPDHPLSGAAIRQPIAIWAAWA